MSAWIVSCRALSASAAHHPVWQPFRQRTNDLCRRHLSSRRVLATPQGREIARASRLCRSPQGRKRRWSQRAGQAGAAGLIGPSSRISRLTSPRACRPLNRRVSAVSSDWAAHRAARCTGDVVASGQHRNAVPTCTPAAPPAAITGTRTARTTWGSSANVPLCIDRSSDGKWPRWPPASRPCAITASTPLASIQRACLAGCNRQRAALGSRHRGLENGQLGAQQFSQDRQRRGTVPPTGTRRRHPR